MDYILTFPEDSDSEIEVVEDKSKNLLEGANFKFKMRFICFIKYINEMYDNHLQKPFPKLD